jgi:hypothetical protein
MAKNPSPSKENALLATIQEKMPASGPQEESRETVQPETSPEASSRALISFRPEDRQRIRELSLFFASQGLRPNDSLVVKSALHAVRPGSELLAAYHELVQADRRRKKRQAKQ